MAANDRAYVLGLMHDAIDAREWGRALWEIKQRGLDQASIIQEYYAIQQHGRRVPE